MMNTVQTEAEAILTRREWYGHLTVENAPAIAERIKQMLVGRTYTFVAYNDYFNRVEVRSGMMLEPHKSSDPNGSGIILSITHAGEKYAWGDTAQHDSAHMTVIDSYGVWGLDTTRNASEPPVRGDEYSDFHSPYLVFEGDRYGNRLRIHLNNGKLPDGSVWRIQWVISVEPTLENARYAIESVEYFLAQANEAMLKLSARENDRARLELRIATEELAKLRTMLGLGEPKGG